MKLKGKEGITLIALVIIIIVLVIIVGVSTKLMFGQKGIETRENVTQGIAIGQPQTSTKQSYVVGDTFTVNGETFYVIDNSDANTEIVKGLATKNIDINRLRQSDNAQTVSFCSEDACGFDWDTLEGGFTSKEDLNNNERVKKDKTSAVYKAMQYAEKTIGNGAKGRLMTIEEVVALGGYNWDSSKCPSWINSSNYWIGSAFNSCSAWIVFGEDKFLHSAHYDFDYGVRPVIEISKSLIS